MAGKIINIALVDDHSIVMDGISSLLKQIENMNVVGKSNDRETFIAILEQQTIDLAFVDLFLPKPVGFEILKEVKAKYPNIKVIIFSGNEEEQLITTAFQHGANGYLTKNVDVHELEMAIKTVMGDAIYLSSALEKLVSKNFIKKAISGDKYGNLKLSELSPREIEIIILLCEGLSFKEIAKRLEISMRTVESHKSNILEKLDLTSTIDLVKYAIKNKMIDL